MYIGICVCDRGAKRMFCFISYIACVALALAPSVVAPPEKNFTQGQPELQQAMDNMVAHNQFMKRTPELPSAEDRTIPHLLSDRTTQLLHEAERMITPAKETKEKEWMEGFIHKLQLLTSVLQQGTANQSSENASNNVTLQDSAQSLNNSTVPEGHPLKQNSSDPIAKTVPESEPNLPQSDQITSKPNVTLPETNQAEPLDKNHSVVTDKHHSVVTKPGLSPAEEVEEEDELVRELESLHKVSSAEPTPQHLDATERPVEASTQATVEEQNKEAKIEVADEKEKIKERLAAEVAELKRLGGTEEEIIRALHIDNFKFIDAAKKADEAKGRNKFSDGHESVKRVLNEETHEALTEAHPNYWNLHATQPARPIYMNNTFLGMHINLPPINPRVLRGQFHYGLHRNALVKNAPYYHPGLRDTIQRFHGQNYMLRNHIYSAPNAFQQERPDALGPAVINPEAIPQSGNRPLAENPHLNQHPKLSPKSIYMPYPVPQNSEYVNDVAEENKMATTTSMPDPHPTEFSDEMKRQLRDGKVILLSDNVVRSNFSSEEKGEAAEKSV